MVEAQDSVGFREAVGQLTPIALGHAPGRYHLGARACGGEQCLDRILLGLLHEAAGVDEHHVGLRAVSANRRR